MGSERQRVAAEIAEQLAELARVATAHSMGFLAYLIENAKLEAESESRTSNPS